MTLYQLIRAQAEHRPGAIAVSGPGHMSIRYSELFDQIQATITSFSKMGIRPNDRVAMVLPNAPETAVAFIAVSSGATSAPLNPKYQKREFEFYLTDLQPKALIIQAGLDSPAWAAAQDQGIPIIELYPSANASAGVFALASPSGFPVTELLPAQSDDIALVLHTSGTTSSPKRVPLTHKSLCASALNIGTTLGLTEADRCLNLMPLFHIHGLVGGLLSSLAAGASCAIAPGFDSDSFFDWIKELEPTWYTAVPTIHQAILKCARNRGESLEARRLRFIRSSSSPLPAKVMAELEEVFNAPVIEAYGMTEASHQITSNPLPPSSRKSGSVGVPGKTAVAVMDEAEGFVPAGETGEIVIRGASVTSGYESNPEANERAFTGGWFRTGDQGYLDLDGYLFLTGRLKEIINRGGEKISPREIDEALLELPDVVQAVTFPIPHPSLGEDIGAAVVVENPMATSEAKIRDALAGRLVDFKIPSRLLIVDEIPKGATGKVLRLGLADKLADRLKTDFVAPKNGVEALVASIYAEVLAIRQVSARENFFALGGDSLRATQVVSRLRSLFAIDLPIATVLAKASVAELAKEVAGLFEALDETSKASVFTELKEFSEENTKVDTASKRAGKPVANVATKEI